MTVRKTAKKPLGFPIIPLLILVFFELIVSGCPESLKSKGNTTVSFAVTADMRGYTGDSSLYFGGICKALEEVGRGDFMVSPGDIDPPADVRKALDAYMDTSYSWYPVVGNHEAETSEDMNWIKNYNEGKNQNINSGPVGCEFTTYSFDRGNAHFIVLNEYYDGISETATDGDVSDALYDWLAGDLSSNKKPVVFVFGHEPAFPQPDAESGRERHMSDSLNKYPGNRDRFWSLLSSFHVTAYVCGHTHNYSARLIDGVWQIDAGHARGIGDMGSKSTFIMFYVLDDSTVWACTYRLDYQSNRYMLYEKLNLTEVAMGVSAEFQAVGRNY